MLRETQTRAKPDGNIYAKNLGKINSEIKWLNAGEVHGAESTGVQTLAAR